jgi:hypothetical protein
MFVGNVGFSGIIIVGLIVYLLVCIKFLAWCAKIARKVERSPVGFVWLGFFTPVVAWAILLTLNKDGKYGMKFFKRSSTELQVAI